MVIVSFCGNCTYVGMNDSEIVVVDKSYNYGLPSSITKRIVYYDTGIAYGGNETVNRRLRIAKLMLFSLKVVGETDVVFLDADVNIPGLKNLNLNRIPTSFCIPAVNKNSELREIIRFCYSTNLYIPLEYRHNLEHALSEYLSKGLAVSYPIDIYINDKLNTQKLYIDGTVHYIDGKPIVLHNYNGLVMLDLSKWLNF
jgi:hypothetical protein